jgi:hypothetical protein
LLFAHRNPQQLKQAGPQGILGDRRRVFLTAEAAVRKRVNVSVLILIALVAGGLVLAGIGKVREAAAQMQCNNNLKQIALALHNYHDSTGHFPSGTLPNPDPYLLPERHLSWYVDITCYMDQTQLVIDRTKPWDAAENNPPKIRFHGVDWKKIEEEPFGYCKAWLCPSIDVPTDPERLGPTHFVGIGGVGPDAAALLSCKDPRAGLFGYDRKTRSEDLNDSLANTLMLMETATANGPWTAGGPATVRSLEPGRARYLGENGPFSSRHWQRGTNSVFADGSVRALSAKPRQLSSKPWRPSRVERRSA